MSATRARQRPGPRGATGRPGKSRWAFPAVLLAVLAAGVVAVVVVALGDDNERGPYTKTEISAEVRVGGADLPPYEESGRDGAVGRPAPTLGSVDFDGRPVTAGGATGRPYALVFLAHWCPHCQAEVPRLVAVGEGEQIAGVDVIGVPTGTSSRQPNYPPSAWLRDEDWPYPVLLDDARGSAAAAYGLTGYPFMVFVDASGTVAGRFSGELSEGDLRSIFTALAAGTPLPLPRAGASSPR